jgi:hypothetical protein
MNQAASRFGALTTAIESRFAKIDERFAQLDARFEKLNTSRAWDKIWWFGLTATTLGVCARGFHWI